MRYKCKSDAPIICFTMFFDTAMVLLEAMINNRKLTFLSIFARNLNIINTENNLFFLLLNACIFVLNNENKQYNIGLNINNKTFFRF